VSNLAHKIAIKTSKRQSALLEQFANHARFAYTWGLERWNTLYQAGCKPSVNQIDKDFNKCKKVLFPWIYSSPKDAMQTAIKADLKAAFNRFFKEKKGYPKFKSKHKSKLSFTITNDKFSIQDKIIKVPKLGELKLREKLRYSGKIMSATFSFEGNRWFVSIQVDLGAEYRLPKAPQKTIGVDLGISTALVTNEKDFWSAPRPLRKALKKLKYLNKELSRRVRGSSNWDKTKVKLKKLYFRIKSIRLDWIHKKTFKLSDENQVIFLESLNVEGMLKNSNLALHLADISFHEIKRQLVYKTELRSGLLHGIDRWLPSSKLCSSCGWKNSELKLKDRRFKCECCGLDIDRDLNAAININTAGHAEIKACGEVSSGFEWLLSATTHGETDSVKQESKVVGEFLYSSTF